MTQITSVEQLRKWIDSHKCHYLNAETASNRTLKGHRKSNGRAGTARVSAKVFHSLGTEIVWMHDPDASDHLGPDELFGLRKAKSE